MMRLFYKISIVLFLLTCFSCKEEVLVPETVNLGYQYFPLTEGHWVRYAVETITIDAPSERYDTTHYELKEVFSRAAFDSTADGVLWYIEQWRRTDSLAQWQKVNASFLRKNTRMLLRTDDNIAVVKQCYPFTRKTSWDGNAFNQLADEEYSIVSVAQKDTIGKAIFDSVTTVQHRAIEQLFEKKYEAEKYASGVGLIYFQQIDVESQSSSTIQIDVSKPIMTRITKGAITTQKVLSWK